MVDPVTVSLESDDDAVLSTRSAPKRRRLVVGRSSINSRRSSILDADDSGSGSGKVWRSSRELHTRSSGRVKRHERMDYEEEVEEEEDDVDELAEESDTIPFIHSDIRPSSRYRQKTKGTKRGLRSHAKRLQRGTAASLSRISSSRHRQEWDEYTSDTAEPTRRSGRVTVTKSMTERGEDDEIFADESATTHATKVVSVREVFQPLPTRSRFREVHMKTCDTCGQAAGQAKGPLIHCQGCTISYHQSCLGVRSQRDHIATKVDEHSFVLQCRRCIGLATKKDPMAPRLDVCQICHQVGTSCEPFSLKKTAKQEEKLRETNGGTDPITPVTNDRLNNADTVLFRCTGCYRAYHFEHLPPLTDSQHDELALDVADIRDERLAIYRRKWQCKACLQTMDKVQALVAWRPTDIDSYTPGSSCETITEDNKEYLVKWENKSYFWCTWIPGAWVWGVVSPATRRAFMKREDSQAPKMNEEDAIPEEFFRMEIILDVKFSSHVGTHTEAIDRARVKEVESVLVKFQGLSYEDVVWEHPPSPDDGDRWMDFMAAYNEYVAGKYFLPTRKLKERIADYRKKDFERNILMQKQPARLTGGKMMEYQIEGMNWLLYNYHRNKNVILADEMGLGKTIQVIAALATLIKEKPRCYPFLVVVPNSTCPNWRREIKHWAPSLRVVTYYGSKKAKEMAMQYEMYPDGSKDLKAHIIVTSFEAPVEDSFFRKVDWAGMIVDEGQRLKNDKNLLYMALKALRVPYRVLLTGDYSFS